MTTSSPACSVDNRDNMLYNSSLSLSEALSTPIHPSPLALVFTLPTVPSADVAVMLSTINEPKPNCNKDPLPPEIIEDVVSVATYPSVPEVLNNSIPNQNVVILILGVLSAIIDNVPLVAASMGMYNLPLDDSLWHLIAYSAGTGGSMLIIGSAAGVAAMGMEKIDFIWYLKKIAWLAAIGFAAGFSLAIFFV